jgi:hypothetical protein
MTTKSLLNGNTTAPKTLRKNSIMNKADYDGWGGKKNCEEGKKKCKEDRTQKFIKQLEKTSDGFVLIVKSIIEASNQVGIITTLIMGISMGILSSLVGHWWDNHNSGVILWKIQGVVVSCIISIFVSSLNILGSFIFSTKYLGVKQRVVTKTIDFNMRFERILTDGFDIEESEINKDHKIDARSRVDNYKVESLLLSSLTFASMVIFPIACLFGCLVSMTDNDIPIHPNTTELYARNDGADIDSLESAMLYLMVVLTSIYVILIIYGMSQICKNPPGLHDWATRIDNIIDEMNTIVNAKINDEISATLSRVPKNPLQFF